MATGTEHWNAAYSEGDSGVSWFQSEASASLELIESISDAQAAVIDVGGGSSPLVDGLLERGYQEVAVLDVADSGLAISRERLGEKANDVDWIVANLLKWRSPRSYDVWHDRAVLHFFVKESERAEYLEALRTALKVGGHVVLGVFAEDGPEQCSGLTVRRYSQDDLREFLGNDFETVGTTRELHATPRGKQQPFNLLTARRVS